MEISSCIDDVREQFVFLVLAVIAEVFLCFLVSWSRFAIFACVILDVFLVNNFCLDWFYLCKNIMLDEQGCTFVTSRRTKTFTWKEIYMQHIDNTSFLFGDSEISGEGIILSSKPISKPTYLGAMTYCKFSNPCTSVFIRFESAPDRFKVKKSAAKFVYQGFSAEKKDVLHFIDARNNLNST